MSKNLLFYLNEVDYKFKQRQFHPLQEFISFENIVYYFIDRSFQEGPKFHIWNVIEHQMSFEEDDQDVFDVELIDLMLDLFDEFLNNYIKNVVGASIVDMNPVVIKQDSKLKRIIINVSQ